MVDRYEPETIVNRLRGIYDVGPNAELRRDFSESEFIKPINLEAAKRIEQLESENKALKDILKKAYKGFSDDNPDLAFELLDDNRDLIL